MGHLPREAFDAGAVDEDGKGLCDDDGDGDEDRRVVKSKRPLPEQHAQADDDGGAHGEVEPHD